MSLRAWRLGTLVLVLTVVGVGVSSSQAARNSAAPAAGDPSPEFGKTVVVTPVSGRASALPRGSRHWIALSGPTSLEFGFTVQSYRGIEVSYADRPGRIRSAEISGGRLVVFQPKEGTLGVRIPRPRRGCDYEVGHVVLAWLKVTAAGPMTAYGQFADASPLGNVKATWRIEERCDRRYRTTRVLAVDNTIAVRDYLGLRLHLTPPRSLTVRAPER